MGVILPPTGHRGGSVRRRSERAVASNNVGYLEIDPPVEIRAVVKTQGDKVAFGVFLDFLGIAVIDDLARGGGRDGSVPLRSWS